MKDSKTKETAMDFVRKLWLLNKILTHAACKELDSWLRLVIRRDEGTSSTWFPKTGVC